MFAVLGWLGGLLVAGGYVMVSLRRVAPDSTCFQMLNVAGATMLGLSCAVSGAWAPACLNALWLVIGLRSLLVGRLGRVNIDRPVVGSADFRAAA
ncbi:CBU_0592 family membrane protein [Nocardioides salsibiostraticola]